jgi:hypothetical protein
MEWISSPARKQVLINQNSDKTNAADNLTLGQSPALGPKDEIVHSQKDENRNYDKDSNHGSTSCVENCFKVSVQNENGMQSE